MRDRTANSRIRETALCLKEWNAIPQKQRTQFAPVFPDFVVEIRSPSDNLKLLQEKLKEYLKNGASLGWLIDRKKRKVYIYRPQSEVKCLNNSETVSGAHVLPGFSLKMEKIW